jgi:hypothetical protein
VSYHRVPGSAVSWGTALQAEWSRVSFQIFHCLNPSGRTIALGLTQLLTGTCTRNIPWGIKAAGAYGWQPCHFHVPIVWKSWKPPGAPTVYLDQYIDSFKQDRQCTHNVTSRRVWNSNKYYTFRMCVCSLSYQARKVHAPYYSVMFGLSGSAVFFHIVSINLTLPLSLNRHLLYYHSSCNFTALASWDSQVDW